MNKMKGGDGLSSPFVMTGRQTGKFGGFGGMARFLVFVE